MLFRKNIEHRCAYCMYAAVAGEDRMICPKQGIVPLTHSCRKFTYDPFKRALPKPKEPNFKNFDARDFSL